MRKNKTYIGIVRRDGYMQHIEYSDYNSKKDFARDLRGNGYRVSNIFTLEEINYIKENDCYELLNKQKGYKLCALANCIEYIKACL